MQESPPIGSRIKVAIDLSVHSSWLLLGLDIGTQRINQKEKKKKKTDKRTRLACFNMTPPIVLFNPFFIKGSSQTVPPVKETLENDTAMT